MKKIINNFFLIFLLSQSHAQQNNSSDMEALKELNAKFINNFVTNDTVSHSKIIHKDFVCISSAGQCINRKDYLEGWLHGFDGFTYWDYRDENIKIFGNTALVHARNKYMFIRDGKETTGMSMYTDVYVKENGEWKCVQAQISKVSPEFYTGDETIVRKYDYRK
jgi:ketosteroid isomerase-like protein